MSTPTTQSPTGANVGTITQIIGSTLDAQFAELSPVDRAKAEDLARKWFGTK